MKKIFLMATLLLASTSITLAQDDTRENLHAGAKIGLNYSNVYDSNGEDFEADGKFGFVAGGFVAIPIGKFMGVQPEVLFSQKGFQGSGKVFGMNYTFSRTTNYLDIPLYFALKPAPFVTILAGPQFSYLFSRKDVFTSSLISTEQEQDFKNDDIRKNTLGASVGIDINISPIVIGLRANWDLQENNANGSSTTPRYKNQWLQLTAGFRF